MVSSGNGMVSFQHHNFKHFLTSSAFFKFLFFLIQVVPDPGARKHPKGFDNKLLTSFFGHGIVFHFLMSQNLLFSSF